MPEMIRLMADIELQPEELRIAYTVHNASEALVYLTNHGVRFERGQGPVPDRMAAYVWFEKGTAHVSKRRPPPPETFHTPWPYFVTPLGPLETFQETLLLPLPLRECRPYATDVPGQTRFQKGLLHQIYFSLGYIENSPYVEALETVRSNFRVFMLRWRFRELPPPPPDARPDRELIVASPPVPMELPAQNAVEERS